jgi:hypothetical protein
MAEMKFIPQFRECVQANAIVPLRALRRAADEN